MIVVGNGCLEQSPLRLSAVTVRGHWVTTQIATFLHDIARENVENAGEVYGIAFCCVVLRG